MENTHNANFVLEILELIWQKSDEEANKAINEKFIAEKLSPPIWSVNKILIQLTQRIFDLFDRENQIEKRYESLVNEKNELVELLKQKRFSFYFLWQKKKKMLSKINEIEQWLNIHNEEILSPKSPVYMNISEEVANLFAEILKIEKKELEILPSQIREFYHQKII